MIKTIVLFLGLIVLSGFGCKTAKTKDSKNEVIVTEVQTPKAGEAEKIYLTNKRGDRIEVINLSDEEWSKKLSKEQFYVLRKKGTERAFTGEYHDNKKEGLYMCSACEQVLFSSNAKFDSGTGWPSFFRPDDDNMIKKSTDNDLGYARTEVMCGRCGGHLGHVFDDGPPPTGLRYCINSISLKFIEAKNGK